MNIWNNAVITNKGLALQSKLMEGHSLEITRAIAGSGYVTPDLLQNQTDVIDAQQELIFRPVSYPEYGKCKLPLYLTNEDVTVGYKVRMIYVMANDPDEGEIVFFVAQSARSDMGTIVPTASEMAGYSAEWTFYFQYGRADGVNVTVDPANTVSRNEMETYVGEEFVAISTTEIDSIFES